MAFERTLRMVQMGRAATTISACISVIFFAFVIKLRADARYKFLKELNDAHPDIFDIGEPSHGAWGGVALGGLALSVAWNGLCFIDLMLRKHYRFDRRICIFVDIIVALVLAITGFLNFAYDAVIYFALELASGSQVRLEIAAVVFLAFACLAHIGFFCYGCKDPNAVPASFEHEPLAQVEPNMPHQEYHDARSVASMRSRSNTSDVGEELVEIDLGKKVQIFRLHPHPKDLANIQKDVASMRTPPRTPREDSEHKRLGMVGAPPQIATQKVKAEEHSEESPFLDTHASEWI